MSKIVLVTGRSTYHSYMRMILPYIYMLGGNAGIGCELVRLLAEKGHIVYLGARNEISGKEAECV